MKRVTRMVIMMSVTAVLAGCGAPNATGSGEASLDARDALRSVAAALDVAENGPREVKGQLVGIDEYGDWCGSDQGVTIISTGTGNVSHFGETVMVSTSCVDLSTLSVIGPIPVSMKAANGDEAGGFVTALVFTSVGFDFYTSITWGTGRFEGATGELVFRTETTGPGTWSSGVEGWITY